MATFSRRRFLLMAAAGAAGAAAFPGLASLAFQAGPEFGDLREDSLWTKEAPIEPVLRLEGELVADVAIIGGGYTGLACAYYCKKLRPELSVVLLESHRLASGASSRNSGAVSRSYRGIGKTPLSQRGFDRLLSFIEEEQVSCDLKHCAVLELFPAPKKRRALPAQPEGVWIPAEELRAAFQSSYYGGAVETTEYVTLHPGKLAAGHVRAARRAGAELYENSPVLEIKKTDPAVLVTPHAAVSAKHVFIATNAYTPRLGLLQSLLLPVHQFTLATRKLGPDEIRGAGLDRWPLRFERTILPVTNHLTPSGHFFIRIVLGYAGFNSCRWEDLAGAEKLAKRMFEQRYPRLAGIELSHAWHGVTGHTLRGHDIARPLADGNILVSAGYNGLGIMPGHNNGYLAACRFAGRADPDTAYFDKSIRHFPVPGEFYRSLILKPFMKLMTPV